MAIEHHAFEQPAWLVALVETVMESMTPLGFVGPLGYRWWSPGDEHNEFDGWYVAVYTAPYLAVGGVMDGARCVSGFRLDLLTVLSAFAHVDDCAWHAPITDMGLLDGPSLFVIGTFAGKKVQLQICHSPPQDEPEACRVDSATGTVANT